MDRYKMLSPREIHLIYQHVGVDLHTSTWAGDSGRLLELIEKKTTSHFGASMQVLGATDPNLKRYWQQTFWPLAVAFQNQLKNPSSEYKSWGVMLPALGRFPETLALAMLASAPSQEQAILAMRSNQDFVGLGYEQGRVVVLATDSSQIEVNVAGPDKNWERDFRVSRIVRWLNDRYRQNRSPQHMIMTWLAGVGRSQLYESAQNLGGERTIVFTNLLKTIPDAKRYCRKFGWRYPGDKVVLEATLALYVAHEHVHGIRQMGKVLDELSADVPALVCTLELAQSGQLAGVSVENMLLVILAEHGATGRQEITGNKFVDSYIFSSRCIFNSMHLGGLIVPEGKRLKLDDRHLGSFLEQLGRCEEVLAQNGSEREIIQSLPVGKPPEQLTRLLY